MIKFNMRDPLDIPVHSIHLARKKPIIIRCIPMTEEFEVETLEGVMRGKAGDYLMIGIKGELYPCDLGIFKETYDIISENGGVQ